jgi:hypothetical protein
MQARPLGAHLHDYWQQASKRGAAKEVRFPGFRPDGDGERRADHGGERDEAQVVREEGGGGRARRAVDRAVDAPLGARLGVPRVQHPHRVGVHRAGGLDDDEDDLSALGEGIGVVPCVPSHVTDARGVVEGRLVRRAALLAAEGEVARALCDF